MTPQRRGVPVVVSAPSGAGKTTLCHRLIERLSGVAFSVSHTTRSPRPREQDGRDYHFVSRAQFDALVQQNAFLEWAEVHGNCYGTSLVQAEQELAAGHDVLFDIDVQGGRQIADRLDDAVLVFVVPPDLRTLERRLRGRGSDTNEVVQRRLAAAADEIRAARFYTHFIVNDDLETAVEQLRAIVIAERLRRVSKDALIATLLGDGRVSV